MSRGGDPKAEIIAQRHKTGGRIVPAVFSPAAQRATHLGMTHPLISTRALRVVADGKPILDAIDFDIRPGEIVTLIGPNGSGKTTLLKALMGSVRTTGTIERKVGLKIGYVPQQFSRDPSLPMTVRRFMRVFALPQVDENACVAALKHTGAAKTVDKQMAVLSGGELARVLLARAIARRPDLLILDEPTASVDVSGQAALYHLIGDIRDEIGCGVLLVSHDLHIVMAKSTRVVCLNGHICCEGTAETVVGHPAFRTLFGDKADEIAFYAHHHRHTHTPEGTVRNDG